MAAERQELWCHDCERYVQFDVDTSLNGNHVLNCPNCGHEHCRVVKDGRITDVRWDRRNGPTYRVSILSVGYTQKSTYTTYAAAAGQGKGNGTSAFLYGLWMNTTSGS